jgi:isoquinoline 1-oxidoreductase beta subunit
LNINGAVREVDADPDTPLLWVIRDVLGLGAALRNKSTLTNGGGDQWNFDDYQPLRITDMPKIEVYIVSSSEAPTGVGEPGVPAIAPAISNVVFAATGKRLRSLPFATTALKGA